MDNAGATFTGGRGMKPHMIAVACSLALFSLAVAHPAQAQGRMKACADEWKAMKAANQTAGKKYREFQKECLARSATAPAAGAADTTDRKAKSAKGGGREAARARRRACADEWKADKAAGKVAARMKWPKFWSECSKRKKAEGA
jgi:hypothetical protein